MTLRNADRRPCLPERRPRDGRRARDALRAAIQIFNQTVGLEATTYDEVKVEAYRGVAVERRRPLSSTPLLLNSASSPASAPRRLPLTASLQAATRSFASGSCTPARRRRATSGRRSPGRASSSTRAAESERSPEPREPRVAAARPGCPRRARALLESSAARAPWRRRTLPLWPPARDRRPAGPRPCALTTSTPPSGRPPGVPASQRQQAPRAPTATAHAVWARRSWASAAADLPGRAALRGPAVRARDARSRPRGPLHGRAAARARAARTRPAQPQAPIGTLKSPHATPHPRSSGKAGRCTPNVPRAEAACTPCLGARRRGRLAPIQRARRKLPPSRCPSRPGGGSPPLHGCRARRGPLTIWGSATT